MPAQSQLLFVYGTLKRGHDNHRHLAGAPWAGEGLMAGVDLHDLGPFPMAILGEGRVQGELYRVGEVELARLDRFEGVPRLYRRELRPLSDGRLAWIYLGRPRQVRHAPRLRQGLWPAEPMGAEPADPVSQA
ncbi:MAG: gamma-glutamylcyclotransferase family protein [Synechococcus sp.]|nr:gamma-glutamylcyclotransferase family protein [Synechococcus sp.]